LFGFFPFGSINLGFLLRENLAAIFIIPSSWGSQLDGEKLSTLYHIKLFSGAVTREKKEDFCKGSFTRISFTLF
jgi:hypothetical protein